MAVLFAVALFAGIAGAELAALAIGATVAVSVFFALIAFSAGEIAFADAASAVFAGFAGAIFAAFARGLAIFAVMAGVAVTAI